MSSQKRKYTLRARAQQQDGTRQRIVAATAELHGEVGPARTTVAEIARRAGVQRLTVYNHFPDERELFAACGDLWLTTFPPPDPTAALALKDPAERLRAVLFAFYAWYRATEPVTEHAQRDRLVMAGFDAVMRIKMDEPMVALVRALAGGFDARGSQAARAGAAVALALDFWTWRCLDREGLSDAASADLMVDAVKAAAGIKG